MFFSSLLKNNYLKITKHLNLSSPSYQFFQIYDTVQDAFGKSK